MTNTLQEGADFDIVERFFLRTDNTIGEQIIPLYDIEAVAGLVELSVDNHIPIENIAIPNMPKCDGAVHVIGNSMIPLLRAGDIVLYKITESRRGGLNFGKMYLLDFNIDGENFISIKYVHQSDIAGHYRLESANPDYDPRDIPANSVRMMALVKASICYSGVQEP